MTVSPAKLRLSVNLFAGGSLGILLGFLLGSTTTPLIASVMTALVALLATFFGLSDRASAGTGLASLVRIGAFACGMTAGAAFGLTARTHHWFAPTVTQQIAEANRIVALGAPAQEIVKLLRYGLAPAGSTPSDSKIAQRGNPVFYAAPSGEVCDLLRQAQGEARLAVLQKIGGETASLAEQIANLLPERQTIILAAAPFYICKVD